jgi:hypothetical protein
MPQLIILILEILALYFLSKHLIGKFQKNIFKIFKNKTLATYVFAIMFLPGTFLHELSHWIIAKILFVHTGKFSIKPNLEELDEDKHRLILGHVEIAKGNYIKRLIIGTAPFFLGITLLLFLISWANANDLFKAFIPAVILIYLIFQIANTMFSSREDMKGAWKIALLLAVVYTGAYYLGIRITVDQEVLLSNKLVSLIKQTNIFLLWPIAIDAGLLLTFKALRNLSRS